MNYKFRAWDKVNKQWISNDQLHLRADGRLFMQYDTHDSEIDELTEVKYPVVFWTGLLDKNGTEIYEGDIINIGAKQHTFVVYQAPEFVTKWRTPKGNISSAWSTINYFLEQGKPTAFGEVIGNIYENPELLKKEESNTPKSNKEAR